MSYVYKGTNAEPLLILNNQHQYSFSNLNNNYPNYRVLEDEYINLTQDNYKSGSVRRKQSFQQMAQQVPYHLSSNQGHTGNHKHNHSHSHSHSHNLNHSHSHNHTHGHTHGHSHNTNNVYKSHSITPSPVKFIRQNTVEKSSTSNKNSSPVNKVYDNSNSLNNPGFCIRFAVNGISKYAKGGSTPPVNRNIQAGDFGDDAGMIAENSRCIVIGLADGAGGNRSIGIDPQKFSRSLLGYCVEIIKNEEILPTQMAKLACKSVQILETKNIDGSGTLCLLALNKNNNMMHALNIGDSGFRLVRHGAIRHKSEATMAGSSPKQLYVSESSNYSGISFVSEKEITQDSDVQEFPVKTGDILILSSDGMFDVVEDHVIEKIVNNHTEKDLQGIADELLLQTMKSYTYTQRDDILIMVCRIESKH